MTEAQSAAAALGAVGLLIIFIPVICVIIAFFVFLGIGSRVKSINENLKDIYFKLDEIAKNTEQKNDKN